MTGGVDWVTDTHALVDFLEEDATGIVPVSHLKKKENLEHGGSCLVMWSDEKVYKAFLICTGCEVTRASIPTHCPFKPPKYPSNYEVCAQRQEEIDVSCHESTEVTKRPRKPQNESDVPCKRKRISTYENEKEKLTITDKYHNTLSSEDSYSESESNADDGEKHPLTIVVDDGDHDRFTAPLHYIHSEQQEIVEQIENLKETIIQLHEEQRVLLSVKMQTIDEKIKLILPAEVTKCLVPLVPVVSQCAVTKGNSNMTATVSTSPVTSTGTCSATDTTLANITNSSAIGSEVAVTTELLPQEVLVPSYTKSKSRDHLAAILACKLFDEETLMKSNVLGYKKEKLDPEIIAYIKEKCFYYFSSEDNSEEEREKEWKKCIESIDKKSRDIKKKRKNDLKL